MYLLAAENPERFEILGHDSYRTRLIACEKLLVLVRERWIGR